MNFLEISVLGMCLQEKGPEKVNTEKCLPSVTMWKLDYSEILLAYVNGCILNRWLNLSLYVSIKNSSLMIKAITVLTKRESTLK